MTKENYSNTIKTRIIELNQLVSKRFLLRDLCEKDGNEVYLSWMNDPTIHKYISASKNTQSLMELKAYIKSKSNHDSVRFFGIFDKNKGIHIGNIKYEPINLAMNFAVMGVMIGDPSFRGIGAFAEVYLISAQYIQNIYNINKIFLGVSKCNLAAIKSYEKSGFVVTKDHPFGETYSGIAMVNFLKLSV